MDAQSFLYWALGGGFIVLVLFLCTALVHLIRILKDVADASDSVKETAAKMEESVAKVTEKINETADHLTENVLKPFTMLSFLADKAKPFMDMMQGRSGYSDDEEEKPKKKRRWRRK